MKLGVVMDPIETINFKKDSTLAMMIEAQRKNHEIFYMTPNSLFINSGISYANTSKIEVRNDPLDWFSLEEEKIIKLSELDAILMRQDPPFNLKIDAPPIPSNGFITVSLCSSTKSDKSCLLLVTKCLVQH